MRRWAVIGLALAGCTGAEQAECRSTGCSGEVCSDEEVTTPCEYLCEFDCLQHQTCERQADGSCGWTVDDPAANDACLAGC